MFRATIRKPIRATEFGLKRRQLREVLRAIASDVRGKRWQTPILT
jgi:hypothetical protein